MLSDLRETLMLLLLLKVSQQGMLRLRSA